MKVWYTLSEISGLGFKRMFPTPEYRIHELRQMINPHPTTKEEALKNREITKKIDYILDQLKNRNI